MGRFGRKLLVNSPKIIKLNHYGMLLTWFGRVFKKTKQVFGDYTLSRKFPI
jgi:hypothetical protein